MSFAIITANPEIIPVSCLAMPVLNGHHQELNIGNILYNCEQELDYIYADPAASENFVCMESFITGH